MKKYAGSNTQSTKIEYFELEVYTEQRPKILDVLYHPDIELIQNIMLQNISKMLNIFFY